MVTALVHVGCPPTGPLAVAGSSRPFTIVPADQPLLTVCDAGLEGDGVFESISVIAGAAIGVDEHLDRLNASAATLELDVPDRAVLVAAIDAAITASYPPAESGHRDLAITVVITRGAGGAQSCWVRAKPAPTFDSIRTTGVAAVTLDRGFRHDAGHHAPWLLLGSKQLSYAVNTAALREARRRGAQDVIFVSSDGFVLEGPTSSVLVRSDSGVSTPAGDAGILSGTTQRLAFEFFAATGVQTRSRLIPAAELATATGIWLVSSVRGAVAVTSLDGRQTEVDHKTTAALNLYLTAHRTA